MAALPRSPADPWAVVASPARPAGDVAAEVIAARLGAIPGLLRVAAGTGGAKPIHALRVATRRCLATLAVFDRLIRGRDRRWFSRRLRSLRRAAGKARDLDVLVDRLARDRRAAEAGFSKALADVSRQQKAARKPIQRAWRAFSTAEWRRRVRRTVAAIGGGRARERFDRFAARGLAEKVNRFLEEAEAGPGAIEVLHGLRIRAKKTRYAVEILGGAVAASRRRALLAALERFQDLAGACTDHAVAARRFRRLAGRSRGTAKRRALERLTRDEDRRATAAAQRVRAWVTPARLRSVRRLLGMAGRS